MVQFHIYPGNTPDGLPALIATRDEVRQQRAAGLLHEPVEILVHAGRYRLSASLELSQPDFGTADSPVTWRAAGDGDVVLTGSRPVTVRRNAGDQPHSVVLEAGEVPGAVFANGEHLALSRIPVFEPENPYFGGWLHADPLPDGEEPSRDRFWSRDPQLLTAGDLTGAELFVYPRHNYRNSIRTIASYDAVTGEMRLAEPAVYEIDPGDRFHVRNVPSALTEAGHWTFDAASRELRMRLAGDALELEVDVTLTGQLIVIRDANRPNAPLTTDEWPFWDDVLRHVDAKEGPPSAHLTVAGLICEGCTGTAIELAAVSNVTITGCTVRHTGFRGISVIGGQRNTIAECKVSQTGADGILIAGGQRKWFTVVSNPANHVVDNCYVHHIGQSDKHVAGVNIAGSGNAARHCLIHDAPRWGILSRGDNHLIELNHIRHVNIETADTAGIYLCDRDLTSRGTVIRWNRVHDVLGYNRTAEGWKSPSYSFGIYLDDWTSHCTVHGNLTYNTPRAGIYLNSGQGNVVTNNCCLAGDGELGYYNRWPADMEQNRCGTYDQGLRRNTIQGNILVGPPEGAPVYGLGRNLTEAGKTDVATNNWNRNLIWNHGHDLTVRAAGAGGVRIIPWQEWSELHGQDADSVIEDPGIREDFSLPEDSPAGKIGFEPLPIEQMGLRSGTNWPPFEAEGIREFNARIAAKRIAHS